MEKYLEKYLEIFGLEIVGKIFREIFGNIWFGNTWKYLEIFGSIPTKITRVYRNDSA